MRVLLVEDHDGVAALVGLALRRAGHDVRCSVSDTSWVDWHPDVILLDLHLENGSVDGWDVVLSAQRHAPDARVIVTTGADVPELRARAAELGCEWMPKPYDVDELVELLG